MIFNFFSSSKSKDIKRNASPATPWQKHNYFDFEALER